MILVMYLAGAGAICLHILGPYSYPYEISTRSFWAYSVAPLTTKYNHPVLLLATSIILGLGILGIVFLRRNGRYKISYTVLCILSIAWAIWVWVITGWYATGAC